MLYLSASFFLSSFLGLIFIKLNLFYDHQKGIQKFHQRPASRAGGLAIYTSVFTVSLLLVLTGQPFSRNFFLLLFSVSFIFFSGLLEDITNQVSPQWRLVAGFISGILAFFLASARVIRTDIPFLDSLLSYLPVSLIFSAFAFAGVGHAFNLIDGLHGLASGVAMLVFGGYAYVSFLHGDSFLLYLSLVMLLATLGFFIWNYPLGLIFLGDSGAYFLGFMAAAAGALLVKRHSDISPWFPLLLVIYPVWETLFSVYRRSILKNHPPYLPDALHFHQILYRRLLKGSGENSFQKKNARKFFPKNAYISPLLWAMEGVCLLAGLLFWKNTPLLALFVSLFVVFYTWLYFKIVRFKTPRLLKRLLL
ncbi:MAG: glycosyltransferase [Thermodesulfatator sp.]|nr:MAG: glycosyltransferase [Thermodesulfatator sp.]